jgi:hypothetical protein
MLQQCVDHHWHIADANLGLLSLAGGTLTGALLADDSGTAALPAIAFDGDPNTGIFRPVLISLALPLTASSALSLAPPKWYSTMAALMLTSALKVTPTPEPVQDRRWLG